MENNQQYLPHLINAVPTKGYGNRLSMYLMTLEAWRRGLHVAFFVIDNPDNKMLIRYTIGDGENEYNFESSLGEKVTKYAYDICENKDETKKILSKANLPVPKGKRFREDVQHGKIIEYANELGYPVVIKPISENAGKGVFSNIMNEKELQESIHHLQNELGYKDILLEEHIDGIEHRIFVADDKVVAAVNRIPANIVGDGVHSIEKLIDLKNKSKQNNPTLSSKGIEKDKEVTDSIKSLGYDYNSIPKNGEKIYLRSKSNVSRGGDSIDVTDQLPEEMKRIAENATKAIEGLHVCGLDMIISPDYTKAVIIEVNTKPMLGLHAFPMEGKPIDVISPIIDFYFPDTKEKNKTNLYFDFDAVIAPLRDRSVTKINLTTPPLSVNCIAKKYIINGENSLEFRRKIRLKALQQQIHGYIEVKSKSQVELVIAHEDIEVLEDFTNQIKKIDSDSLLTLEEEEYNLPIKIGFEIYEIPRNRERIQQQRQRIRDLNKNIKKEKREQQKQHKEIIANRRHNSVLSERIRGLEKENKKLLAKNERINRENEEYSQQINNMLKSSSWRVTKPLRTIGTVFKGK